MSNEPITVVWPRDLLLPIIDAEIKQLLQYLTRDNSWKDCFGVQVNVDGIVAKLNRNKLWKRILKEHPETTDDYIGKLVAEVALARGLTTLYKNTQIQMTKKKYSSE